VGRNGNIDSLTSQDGVSWVWDSAHRPTPSQFGETWLGSSALADSDGVGRMYLQVNPDRAGIHSATAVLEPASLALLIVGGLAAFRRRRK
jgi:hypothetical protein